MPIFVLFVSTGVSFDGAFSLWVSLSSVIAKFLTPKNNDSFIISSDLSEESKPFILVKILYCEQNENASKHFIKKFEAFTNHRYRIAIKWITRRVKSLFKVKSKNPASFLCDMQG